jgi:histidinol-phosphate aminotransferase
MSIRIPEYVQKLVPYRSGNQTANNTERAAFKKLINLASNENQLGSSPKAVEAIQNALSELAIYPDTKSSELVAELAKHIGRNTDEIIFGSGSDALIAYIVGAFAQEGEEVLTASGTFVGIFTDTNKQGRVIKTVPLKNYGFDLDGILAAITDKTRIIYLANANNPTGTIFTADEFEKFFAKVPKDILVVLDEAYRLYSVDFEGYPDGLSYREENLLVLQTFSKSYGLAGLRVGYCVGPSDLIGYLMKVKLPFEPNILAQAAAIGALQDEDFLAKTKDLNARMIQLMTSKFTEWGVEFAPAYANFVMILLENEQAAMDFVAGTLARGVVTRHLGGFGIANGVRISTGTEEQMAIAMKVFEELLKK